VATSNPNLTRFEALIIPDEALDKGGIEILRAAIIEGQLHVTLRPAFPEPARWGGLLSEVARRVARAYAVAENLEESEVVFRIHSTFVADSGVSSSRAKKGAKKRAAKIKKSAKKRKRGRR
jgi:hypothetical protein